VKGIGMQMGFSDPVFRKRFKKQTGKQIEDDVVKASMAWLQEITSGNGHKWEDIELLKKHWKGPIVLKGIQHREDAIKAVEVGVDGIIVSNHGGRLLLV
jgi:isopentenyl diphosphate isomerase/L-lactate dehydrogenase-like FMN-dependent dehydrogenase